MFFHCFQGKKIIRSIFLLFLVADEARRKFEDADKKVRDVENEIK